MNISEVRNNDAISDAGRPTTSSIGKGESVITTSAKANIRSLSALSRHSLKKVEPLVWTIAR
jgi:hypothetical protein